MAPGDPNGDPGGRFPPGDRGPGEYHQVRPGGRLLAEFPTRVRLLVGPGPSHILFAQQLPTGRVPPGRGPRGPAPDSWGDAGPLTAATDHGHAPGALSPSGQPPTPVPFRYGGPAERLRRALARRVDSSADGAGRCPIHRYVHQSLEAHPRLPRPGWALPGARPQVQDRPAQRLSPRLGLPAHPAAESVVVR